MQVTPTRTFLYGSLDDPGLIGKVAGPDVAIEILREFSASELVGKVYMKGNSGNWNPVSQPAIRDYTWFKDFRKTKQLKFWMDGSAPWKVLYFRAESDGGGPYMAVGLKLSTSNK